MKKIVFGLVAAVIGIGISPIAATASDGCSKRSSPNAAIEACTRQLTGQPDTAAATEAHLVRGRAYVRKGMNAEAVADFTSALKLSPANQEALLGRGEAYLAKRAFQPAADDFAALIALKPAHVAALIGLGYSYLARDQAENAVAAFSRALQADPRNGVALNNRGLAYKKLGNLDAAISDFTTAVQFHPLYALAYNNRGYAHEEKGDKPRAIRDYRDALAIDPSLAGARDGLVRLGAVGSFAAEASQRVAEGKTVAEKNCAWCHAIGPTGESLNDRAPAFRDIHARHPILALRAPITRAIATPHDAMPKLPLSDADVDRIIAYINSL